MGGGIPLFYQRSRRVPGKPLRCRRRRPPPSAASQTRHAVALGDYGDPRWSPFVAEPAKPEEPPGRPARRRRGPRRTPNADSIRHNAAAATSPMPITLHSCGIYPLVPGRRRPGLGLRRSRSPVSWPMRTGRLRGRIRHSRRTNASISSQSRGRD